MFCNVAELVELAERKGEKISDVKIHHEMEFTGRSKVRKMRQMQQNGTVMKKAIERGLNIVCVYSGLTGGDVVLLQEYIKIGQVLSGEIQQNTVSKGVTTNEDAATRKSCTTPMGLCVRSENIWSFSEQWVA